MTCVVGYADKETGKVYIGADGQRHVNHKPMVMKNPKVFEVGGHLIVGFCGDSRQGQLVQYNWSPISKEDNEDAFGYIVRVAASFRELMKTQGAIFKDDSKEQEVSGTEFLVGYQGRLFIISTSFAVSEPSWDFAAIGSGSNVALGAMYAMWEIGLPSAYSPTDKITTALEAATQFDYYCGQPFTILELDPTYDETSPSPINEAQESL